MDSKTIRDWVLSSAKAQAEDVSRLWEKDPNGLNASSPGAKLDDGKDFAADVFGGFSYALAAVARLGTKGAKKYSLNGWSQVEDGYRRYSNAMVRHLLKEWQGEEVDSDIGVLHATSVAWNALARLELKLRGATWKESTATLKPVASSTSETLGPTGTQNTQAPKPCSWGAQWGIVQCRKCLGFFSLHFSGSCPVCLICWGGNQPSSPTTPNSTSSSSKKRSGSSRKTS